MFPILHYEEGMVLPSTGTYYVIDDKGIWLHKDTSLMRSFVRVENISFLDTVPAEPFCISKMPKLPVRHVWRIKQFFKEVVRVHHAEACTILYYNQKTDVWKIVIPVQQVSHGGVDYSREAITHTEEMNGFAPVGTIHSHADFNAFHSGTDEADEFNWEGLHVTFGHNDREDFSISATLVANSNRFLIDPLEVLEGIKYEGHDRWSINESQKTDDWAEGLSEWMTKVKGRQTFNVMPNIRFSTSFDPKFKVGDHVMIPKGIPIDQKIGNGPFEVVSAESGKITIKTKNGLVSFSEMLFQMA